jgi:hypothetical protein
MTQNGTQTSQGGTSQSESQTQEQLQRMLQVGNDASILLNSPVYNLAYQQLIQQKFEEWMATDPKEERKRESLYHQVKGLVNMTENLSAAVEDAQRILEEQHQESDPEYRRRQYQDAQGFDLDFGQNGRGPDFNH